MGIVDGMTDTLQAEVESWLIPDDEARAEKFQRERIRHHKLVRNLLLDELNTRNMHVLDVGGGPLPVSDLLLYKSRVVVDPLTDEYKKVINCPDHVNLAIEDLFAVGGWDEEFFDLVIATNSLDHVRDPQYAFSVMSRAVTPTGYIAIAGAEDNAITHPHPAHVHNLTADTIHDWADADFETVWELTYDKDDYRYGWRLWDGKRGQPAFAILLRKC